MAGRVGRHPVLRAYITPLTPPAVVMMPTGTYRHGEDAGLGSKRNRQEQQRNSQIAHSTYPLNSSDEQGGGRILEGDAARSLDALVRSLFISTSCHVGLLSHLCRNALLILQGSPCGFDSPLCRLEAVCLPLGVTLQCLGNLGRLASLSGGLGLMPDIYLPRRLFATGRNSGSGGACRWWRVVGHPRSGLGFRCWLQKLGRDRAACEDCEAWIGVLLTELGGLKIPAEPPIRYGSLQGTPHAPLQRCGDHLVSFTEHPGGPGHQPLKCLTILVGRPRDFTLAELCTPEAVHCPCQGSEVIRVARSHSVERPYHWTWAA